MKKTVLVYGLIAGIICGGTLGISGMLNSGSLNFENGMYFGFASMILAAIIMWVGMAAYKKNLGGSISFGKAVGAGVLMALIASSMYVFTWMAMYRTAFAGFGELLVLLDVYSRCDLFDLRIGKRFQRVFTRGVAAFEHSQRQ